MDDNARLARELMGWELRPGYDEECHSWYGIKRGNGYIRHCLLLDWRPDGAGAQSDAQADMVVREVAKLGYRWEMRTYRIAGTRLCYNVSLFGPSADRAIYDHIAVTNRNEHIVAAAIAALDAEKPKVHKCTATAPGAEWRKEADGWWSYYVHDEYKLDARYCPKCGADLNAEA